MSTVFKFGGVAVPAMRPVGWSLVRGTRAYQTGIELPAGQARELYAAGSAGSGLMGPGVAGSIEIRSNAGGVTIEPVYMVTLEPGTTHQTLTLVVADLRWGWSRIHIEKSYNERRRTGNRRLLSVTGAPDETAKLADDVAYAPWSLKGAQGEEDASTAWTVKEMLEDVLSQLHNGAIVDIEDPGITYEPGLLSGPGDVVLAQLLGVIGNADVAVDADGTVRVFQTDSGKERDVLANAGPPVMRGGYPAFARKDLFRPGYISVLFEREHELRFDFTEGADSVSETKRAERTIENVVQLPDLTLTVGGDTFVAGTWVEIGQLLTALESETPQGVKPLTIADLRKYAFREGARLANLYAYTDTSNPSAVWFRRVSAIQQAWRRYFRINPRFMDRIRTIRPYRVGLLDPETGTRAPAQGFGKYTRRPSLTPVNFTNESDGPRLGWIVGAYSDDLSASGAPAPVEIRIVDEDQGIILVEPVADPFGFADTVFPGVPVNFPSQDPAEASDNDRRRAIMTWAQTTAESSWSLAVIVTTTMGAPNSSRRLHSEGYIPDESKFGKCSGPTMRVRVPAGTATARFSWSDDADFTETIDLVFGAFDPEEDPGLGFILGTNQAVRAQLVNEDETEALAEAIGQSILSGMVDRAEGTMTVPMNGDLRIEGSIGSIDHVVEPDGAALSTITMMPYIDTPSIWSYIPGDIEKVLKRAAIP